MTMTMTITITITKAPTSIEAKDLLIEGMDALSDLYNSTRRYVRQVKSSQVKIDLLEAGIYSILVYWYTGVVAVSCFMLSAA